MKKKFKIQIGAAFWLKGLVALLLIMLIFTMASRVAASLTVAKVSVEGVSSRRIQHSVTAEGQIEQNGEIAVVTEADLLVKSLEVSEGQRIKEGDLLAVLDLAYLSEKIDSVNEEIKSIKLQNESLEKNKGQAVANRQMDITRAEQDYNDTIHKNEMNIALAEQALADANARLQEAEQALQEAESQLAVAGKEQNAEKAAGNQQNAEEADGKEQDAEEAAGIPQNVTAASAAVEEKKAAYEECRSVAAEKEAALQAAYETRQSEEKAALRNIEDAKKDITVDNSDQINSISLGQLEQKLEKLEKLQEQEGKIYASQSGVITALYVSVGQKTMDTAFLTMSNDAAGVKFVGQIGKADAENISVGDTATLNGVGKTRNDCKVVSIKENENGESLTVTVSVDSDLFSIGESAQMTVTRDSEEYSYTIPSIALRQENNKMYVLVLDTENTVLGEQDVARKMEVEVEDKNQNYAAISSASLGSDSKIIVDSDRYVEAGDRVRLMEEQ